ncbi:GH1 family beta-glucosidase [Colwelliaceae bacterium 6471]
MHSHDFIFGVATSSFQIEGAADKRLPCIWDTFCNTPGKIKDNSNGDVACEHYSRWEEDLNLIESLGVDAYRLSISWPRVIKLDGTLNQEGVDFYLGILDTLKQKNIKAFVTLYHWDLPQHIEDNGGWLNRETAYLFRDYVDLITQAFGDKVYSYATLNEPFCSGYLGYETGLHAPGIIGKEFGKKAVHHLLLAHGLAMPVLQKNSPNSLNGIVLNFAPCYPYTDSEKDVQAAKIADDHFNHWYIKPLLDARYPDIINTLPEAELPQILADDLAIISQPIDYIGINYYSRAIYRHDEKEQFVQELPVDAAFTDMGWEVCPKAFSELLISYDKIYDLPPIYITENGAAMPDTITNGTVKDDDRLDYYHTHLNAVNDAISQGVNIKGYFAWSLMDNFEWAEGYLKRFGIVYVNYDTQKRTIKNSGHAYRNFITQRKR